MMIQISSKRAKENRKGQNSGLTYTCDKTAIGSSKYRESLPNASPSFLSSFLDAQDLIHSCRTWRAQRMRHCGGQGTSRPVSAMMMGKRVSTALTCCLGRGYERTAADSLRASVLMNPDSLNTIHTLSQEAQTIYQSSQCFCENTLAPSRRMTLARRLRGQRLFFQTTNTTSDESWP